MTTQLPDTLEHCDQCGALFLNFGECPTTCTHHRVAIDPEEDLEATARCYGMTVRCPERDGRLGTVRAVIVNYLEGDAWLIEVEETTAVVLENWMQTLVTYRAEDCQVIEHTSECDGLCGLPNGCKDA